MAQPILKALASYESFLVRGLQGLFCWKKAREKVRNMTEKETNYLLEKEVVKTAKSFDELVDGFVHNNECPEAKLTIEVGEANILHIFNNPPYVYVDRSITQGNIKCSGCDAVYVYKITKESEGAYGF
ncbi:MAG TPA: hypothetical protein VKC54_04260 [Patescibacteria group bacterium]|nr:hypothetical protein [Patescibacteria group bacterium]